MNTDTSSRRAFLKTTATASIFLASAPAVISAKPNSKIGVACIGVRGRGNSVMGSFLAEPDCEITHICDLRAN
ncbi:MAG: gfo/Idh/MocA family oxidoreductase, partial [Verrucomicrobia bacterium]|nr:gfo/Idh/MocA family oxidoreductase [Verrucomicrobiota bacterium]